MQEPAQQKIVRLPKSEAAREQRALYERYVLGALLMWPEKWTEAEGRLEEASFEWPAHRHIYQALVLVAETAGVPDAASVAAQIKALPYAGEPPDGSWLSYTGKLAHIARTADNFAQMLDRVAKPKSKPRVREWADPLPFGTVGAVPEIPPSLAPEPLASFIAALSEALQVPQGACMITVLCSVSVAMSKKASVVAGPDWEEPLNLYGAMVLPPGERKSAILSACRAPLDEWEARAVKHFGERLGALQAEKRILEARARAAEKRAATKNDPAVKDEAIRLAKEASAFPVVAIPQIFVDDITTEKIVSVMQEQGGRVALFSDEGGIFDIMAGLYSSGALKIDAYLKAYDGKSIRVDRVGRASEFVVSPALAMCLGIQPSIVRALGLNPAMRGRGLLGRVLYVLPESMLGKRKLDPEPMPASVKADYRRLMLWLMDLPMGLPNEPRKIKFSPESAAIFREFRGELEPLLAVDADLGAITDWAGKLAGGVARIAALWHSVKCAGKGLEPWTRAIGGGSMQQAVTLGKLLQEHAKAAFGLMKLDGTGIPTLLLEWVTRNGKATFTRRDAYRALARHIGKADEIDDPISFLIDRGYLREAEKQGKSVNAVNGLAARRGHCYEPHPSVLGTPVSSDDGGEYTYKEEKRDQIGLLLGGVANSAEKAEEAHAQGVSSVNLPWTALTLPQNGPDWHTEPPPFDADMDAYGWADADAEIGQ